MDKTDYIRFGRLACRRWKDTSVGFLNMWDQLYTKSGSIRKYDTLYTMYQAAVV